MKSILNKSFQNLKEISEKNKNFFLNAKPFSHIVFNNFFNDQYLEKILDAFPNENFNNYDHNFKNKTEVKLAINSPEKIPDEINSFIEYLNSYSFLNFLQNLTGIKEKLIPDPYLFGGGLHQIKRGGFLKIHSDFNVHPQMRLNRRINLLLYLNKDWKEDWGGQLELWDQQMRSCQSKVSTNQVLDIRGFDLKVFNSYPYLILYFQNQSLSYL